MRRKYTHATEFPELQAALENYVQHRWTLEQFQTALGVSRVQAVRILRGEVWQGIPRPEGLQFPWPGQELTFKQGQPRSVSQEKVQEAFRRYEAEGWSLMDFVSFLGVSPVSGYKIFRGETYAEIPRSVTLDKRTQREKWRSRAKRGLNLMRQYNWNAQQLKEFLDVKEMASVYRLLRGETFPGLMEEVGMLPFDPLQGWNIVSVPRAPRRRKGSTKK